MRLPALPRTLLVMGAALVLAACARDAAPPEGTADRQAGDAPVVTEPDRDQHSYAEPEKVRIEDIALDLAVDFEAKQLSGTATYDIEWRYDGRPYLTRKGDLVDAVARAIKKVTGIDTELSTTGGTSDGRFIADICPQVIELGPTNATIHKINECIPLDELEALPKIYRQILVNLLVETG